MTHRGAYLLTPGLTAPTCHGWIDPIGLVHVPEIRMRASLSQCGKCHHLIAHHAGHVLWDEASPPAAVPIKREVVE